MIEANNKRAKIVVLANHMNGVLKTTLVVNMAARKAADGFRTLIIDVDPQANVAKTWGLYPDEDFAGKGLVDALIGQSKTEDVIHHLSENIDVISADSSLMLLEAKGMFNPQVFQTLVKDLRGNYDYIFIDTNFGLNSLSRTSLSLADYVIVPSAIDTEFLKGLIRFQQLLTNAGVRIAATIPTLVDMEYELHEDELEAIHEIMEASGVMVTRSVIYKSTAALQEIAKLKTPLCIANPKSISARQMVAVIDELGI